MLSDLFNRISKAGIKRGTSLETAERLRLVNLISFIGIPICVSYTLLFFFTGYISLALVFSLGIIVFILPSVLNSISGLGLSVPVFTVSAPVFWSIITVASGKDCGFYLGFIIFSIGPMLFFKTLKEAIGYVIVGIVLFFVSIAGLMLFSPIEVVSYANMLFLSNLVVVLFTIVTVVFLFKKEVDESRIKIQEKNKEILDSITYAKRIQNAILPSESLFKKNWKDSFIFYSPKDIVAGDFYWMEEVDNKVLLAAADCTGHGVPGALVSLVCYNALSKVVLEHKITSPGKILDFTRKFVVDHFSKANEKVKDGMDISLLVMDKLNGEIQWAGANSPLWYVQDNQLAAIQPTKQPIGLSENQLEFETHTLTLKNDSCVYLFSDGFADQFGGKKGKKFMSKQMKDLLFSISTFPMEQQLVKLKYALENWKGDLDQVDDILVIGVRV